MFEAAYKKINYDYTNSVWNVETLGGTAAVLSDSAIVSNGLWDGNFANWVSMRRVDVLRKVLMGGKTNNGDHRNYGEHPDSGVYAETWSKWFNTSGPGPAVSPYNGGYTYYIQYGNVRVNSTNFDLTIQKDIDIEPDTFFNGL